VIPVPTALVPTDLIPTPTLNLVEEKDAFSLELEEAVFITEVPRNLTPALDTVVIYWIIGTIPPPRSGDLQSKRTILLIGDSHIATWSYAFDELGKKYGYQIVLIWWKDCPTFIYEGLELDIRCIETQAKYLPQARALKPEYVFMAHMYWPTWDPDFQKVMNGYDKLLGPLVNFTKPVMLSDNPVCYFHADYCLQNWKRNVQECTCSRSLVFNFEWTKYEKAVAEKWKIPYIDTSDLYCTSDRCPPIVGDIRVMIDTNQVTPQFHLHVLPKFERMLEQHGIHLGQHQTAPSL